MSIFHTKFAAKLFYALPHAANAHANASRLQFRNMLSNPLSVVAYSHHDVSIIEAYSDPALLRARMAENIRECFLNNSERCGFQLRSKAGKILRAHFHSCGDA